MAKANDQGQQGASQKVNKKAKGKAPEASARMNYLFQASHCLLKKKGPCKRILSTHLSHLMVGIGRKAVLRSSPNIKRTICKGCHTLLEAEKTAKIKTKGHRNAKRLQITCTQCGSKKAFPVNKKKPKN